MSPTLSAVAALVILGQGPDVEFFADLCDDLRVAVAAAYERPAFASLAASRQGMARFGPACALSGDSEDRRLACEWHVAPVTNHWEQLNEAIVRCYPRALRMAEPDGARVAHFRFDTILILAENRNYGFRGGSYISYSVMRLPIH